MINRGRTQRALLVAGVSLLSILCGPGVAWGAVIHSFLPEPSETLSHGVPPGSTASLQGPLSGVNALTLDEGHVWAAEKLEGTLNTRIDEFDASIGTFLEPQLNESGELHLLDQGLAVGHATGEALVYVGASEAAEGVVSVFGDAGTLTSTWTGAHTPNGSFTGGGVASLAGVAVDGSHALGDWAAGDVYVATGGSGAGAFNVVNVFTPGAGSGEPAKVAAQLTGTCPAAGVACSSAEIVPFTEPSAVAVSALNGDVLVVDARSVVDVFEPAGLGEYLFVRQITGSPAGTFGSIRAVAVDGGSGEAGGDVYVADEGAATVYQFDGEGQYQGRLTGTPSGPYVAVRSVAVDPQMHRVFVGNYDFNNETGAIDVYGPNIVVPGVHTLPPSSLTPLAATFNGTVQPVGSGTVDCAFTWGEGDALTHTVSCGELPAGPGEVSVAASVEDLQPDTSYTYRLTATNSNGTNPGEPSENETFTTTGPGFRGEWVNGVGAESVTLDALINPHATPTSYYFEYGTSKAYGGSAPATAQDIGAGEENVHVEQHLAGLAAATVYYYRVVAVSEITAGHTVTLYGEGHEFTTPSSSGGPLLPDGRQWEMVSPPEKHGALVETIGEGHITQSAVAGEAFTFVTNEPTEEQPQGYANLMQVMATRGPDGWRSQDLETPHETPSGLTLTSESRFFTGDLSKSLTQPAGGFSSLISSEASEQTPYLREDFIPGSIGEWCVAPSMHCYRPLVTGAPGYANVPEGTEFGEDSKCPPSTVCGPRVIGAASDLRHAILKSSVPLKTGANSEALYEWSASSPPASQLELISVLPGPGETPAGGQPNFGLSNEVARHAVSTDGSLVVWSEVGGKNHLYVRDVPRKETVELDVPQLGAGTGAVAPQFQVASSDGSRVFFTDQQKLTAESAAAGETDSGDLYECKIVVQGGTLTCILSDLTPPNAAGESAKVLNLVLGGSEDGSRLYFVADGVLENHGVPVHGAVQGNCTTNQSQSPEDVCNLYAWHEGVVSLVAVLSAEDGSDWVGGTQGSAYLLARMTARVSPNGRWVAFMSQRSLTGYDTRDAATGVPDEEVYLYDAGAARVTCASCAPSGARPVGIEYGRMSLGIDGDVIWAESRRLAATVPAWTAYFPAETRYQPRYLTDNGRVFFNSSDAIVPADQNGVGDVYQFEPDGVGGCTPDMVAPSTVFVPAAVGCVGLISSGRGKEESGFLDASATGGRNAEGAEGGGDVFFFTVAQLSKQDRDAGRDVYDAHECRAASPCFPPTLTPPLPCNSSDECKPPPGSEPEVFGVPSSATLTGGGNLRPTPRSSAHRLTPAQLLAAALKKCRKYKNHKRRSRCEHTARLHHPLKRTHHSTRGNY